MFFPRVKTLGSRVFKECRKLTEVYLTDVLTIGNTGEERRMVPFKHENLTIAY